VDDRWQLLSEVQTKEPNRIEAQAFVPVDSYWFSGHFPGEPILPGIALVYTVLQAIAREAAIRGEEIRLDTLKKIRFTSPVRPGEKLSLLITHEGFGKENLFSFKVSGRENVVCSGLIIAGTIKKAKKEETVVPENKDIKGIIQRVAEIIIEELKLEDVTADSFNPDLDLIDELGIDSMDLATIALVLQDEYKITIDEDDYPKLKTVRLIASYIEEKLNAKS
jgi:acyl carrier protein